MTLKFLISKHIIFMILLVIVMINFNVVAAKENEESLAPKFNRYKVDVIKSYNKKIDN